MNVDEIKKYDYIDALRGFAIMGVIFIHSSNFAHPTTTILFKLAQQGARGVQLFFIASALTLFLSLEYRSNENKPILSFYIRRFFRIAPAFYFAILIYSFYESLFANFSNQNVFEHWQHILLTGFFLHIWHPETINSVVPGGWTIGVEMTFYLLVPFLYMKLKTIKDTLIALFVSLVVAKLTALGISTFLTYEFINNKPLIIENFQFFMFFSQLPIFILGILLFQIIKFYPRVNYETSLLLVLLSFILFAGFLDSHSLLPRHFLYGVGFVIFSLSLHHAPHILFVNKLTILIGKLSFSLYLVHFMVINCLKVLVSNRLLLEGDIVFLLSFIIILIISIPISYLINRLIEKPGINLGKYILKKIDY